MLGRVFVDTGAWFALQVQDDAHHQIAGAALPLLLATSRALVTSNLIVGETYTLLRTAKGYPAAKRFLDTLKQSLKLDRLFVTTSVEERAYQLLHRYADHPLATPYSRD